MASHLENNEPALELDVLDSIEKVATLLQTRPYTVALAGAGVSKESGIPTFRGSDGLWTKNGEPPLDQYQRFIDDPLDWWHTRLANDKGEFAQTLDNATPNRGHTALANLENLGVLRHLITQNIDDLHRRAGHLSLTEIHGNRFWMRCIECGDRLSKAQFAHDPKLLPPRCTIGNCNGIIKSDTVMFGELIPHAALAKSQIESKKSEVFMAIGTSALVYPAAAYPLEAMQNNKPLIEINPEVTQLSEYATIVIRAPSGIALPLIVDRIKELDLVIE
jgi:NAD-dependent deacetylase